MEKKKLEKRKMFEIVSTDLVKAVEIIGKIKADWENGYIVDYAYILHNKDIYNRLDVIEGKKIGDKKADHYHIGFKTKNANSFKTIANRYSVKENFIESIKSGRFNDYLLYLTHRNAPTKYQYNDDEVNTSIEDWKIIRDAKEMKNKAFQELEMYEMYLDRAVEGVYTYSDVGTKIPKTLYVKKKNAFDSAFAFAREEKANVINKEGIDKEIIFITGGSGTGKTTYGKKYAEKHNMSYYVSGSSNDVLDSYKGQECIILDDIRGSDFELSNFIKLIDNNTVSDYQSRYQNKLIIANTIIITTTQSLSTFMKKINTSGYEDLKQIRRRIGHKIKITKDEIEVFEYNKDNDCYSSMGKTKNTIQNNLDKTSTKKTIEDFEI